MKGIRDAPTFDPVPLQDPAFVDSSRGFGERHLHRDELRCRVDGGSGRLVRVLFRRQMVGCGYWCTETDSGDLM